MSLMTLLLAGVIANYEWDLKKLIAYSTLSQLGFMINTFSLGLVMFRFFHLVTHAIFKASLFISAGVVIHRGDNRQEFRNSFNLVKGKPFIGGVIIICLFCLGGIPFTRGFFFKGFNFRWGRKILFFFSIISNRCLFNHFIFFTFFFLCF